MRWLTPVILFAAAGFVRWNNAQGGAILAFPFLGVIFPEVAGDYVRMGELSVALIAALGGLTLLMSLVRAARARGGDEA